ncbi:MAG: aryl-sulfate sulfotransferase [Ignavibacteriaceae bacterium]
MKTLITSFTVLFFILASVSVFSQSFRYISPKDNSTLVSLSANIILISSDKVDPASLSSNEFSVTGEKSGSHSGAVKLSGDGETIIFNQASPFLPNEEITVVVHSGIKTIDGNGFSELTFHFRTTPLLQKININPLSFIANGSLVNKIFPSPAESSINKITSTDSLPSDFPQTTVGTSNNPADGKIFLANFSVAQNSPYGNYLMILNNDGSVVKYKKLNQPAFDFKVQPNGELSYAEVITIGKGYAKVRWIVMDTTLTQVDTFQCGNGYVADLHDFVLLPNGHALLEAFDAEPVDMSLVTPGGNPNATVIGGVIQEVDAAKNVVFQWRSWDYLPITDSYVDLTTQIVDYLHINALDIDNSGNIIMSSRHLSSIFKIDRQTGNIDWILGGKQNEFTFINEHESNAPTYFSFQHDVKVQPNGDLTLFDNGNQHTPSYSRGVEYQLDEANKTASLVWEFRHSPDIYNFAMGSVQKLSGGNTFIGWGMASATGSAAVTELNPDNSTALELFLPGSETSYRAFKFPWASQTPEAKVTNYEVLQDNTYKFNSADDTTGITIKFNLLNDVLYANAEVIKYNYAPLNPQFDTTAPLFSDCYFTLLGQGITSYSGEVYVSLNYFPEITSPQKTIVYVRPSGAQTFIPLATSYDSTKNELIFTANNFGDFTFGIPQNISANVPVSISPIDSEIVNEQAPVNLVWGTRGVVQSYRLQVATDSSFTNLVVNSSNLSNTSFELNQVGNNSVYYWRVNNSNSAGVSDWSNVFHFYTASPFIKILYPTGNEDLYDDSTYVIRWKSNVSDTVKIELIKSRLDSFIIGDSLASYNNAFAWKVSPDLDPDSTYKIKISSVSNPNLFSISDSSFTLVGATTGIANTTGVIKNFVLNQNYPNPFNPSTIINYQIPFSSKVVLKVYDVLGNEIATLVNEEQPAGSYDVQFSSQKYQLASGIYFYRLQAGNYVSVKKLLLLK